MFGGPWSAMLNIVGVSSMLMKIRTWQEQCLDRGVMDEDKDLATRAAVCSKVSTQ